MKKITSLLFALFLTVSVFAQSGLEVFVKPGLNLTHFWGQDFPDGFNRIVAGAAVFGGVNYFFTENIAISAGIGFTQKGAAFKQDGVFLFIKGVTRVDYIEFPILAIYSILPESNIQPRVFAGIAPAVLIGAKTRTKEPTKGVTLIGNSIHNFDFGVVFGANVPIFFGNFAVVPGVRYTLGVFAINQDNNGPTRNGALVFSVGGIYKFN